MGLDNDKVIVIFCRIPTPLYHYFFLCESSVALYIDTNFEETYNSALFITGNKMIPTRLIHTGSGELEILNVSNLPS